MVLLLEIRCRAAGLMNGDSRYGVYHVESHLHTAVGVVESGVGQAAHTVVAVAQDFYPHAVVVLEKRKQIFNYLLDFIYVCQNANLGMLIF